MILKRRSRHSGVPALSEFERMAMSKQWFVVGLVVLVMGTLTAMAIRFAPDAAVAVGSEAPDFRLVDLAT